MPRKLRLGLALGSGSARGWAHIGVIRALEERGVKPEIVCGSSIGALVGAAYASGKLDQLEAWVTGLTWTTVVRLMDLTWRGGLIRGTRLFTLFRTIFEDREIPELPIPYGAVATELNSGRELWLRHGKVLEAVRASCAMPGLFTPVVRNGAVLVDGGLVNPVPVSMCRALGAELVIAANMNADQLGRLRMTRGRSSRGAGLEPDLIEQSRVLKGRGVMWQQLTRRERSAPSLFSVMVAALNITQDRITRARLAGDPPDVTIRPELGHIGLLEFDRAAEAIAAGERATEHAVGELQALVASS